MPPPRQPKRLALLIVETVDKIDAATDDHEKECLKDECKLLMKELKKSLKAE